MNFDVFLLSFPESWERWAAGFSSSALLPLRRWEHLKDIDWRRLKLLWNAFILATNSVLLFPFQYQIFYQQSHISWWSSCLLLPKTTMESLIKGYLSWLKHVHYLHRLTPIRTLSVWQVVHTQYHCFHWILLGENCLILSAWSSSGWFYWAEILMGYWRFYR